MARRRARPIATPWVRRTVLREPPVSVGDIVQVTVEDNDHKGRGIARLKDYPILIIPRSPPLGSTVIVKVEKVTSGFALARLEERKAD